MLKIWGRANSANVQKVMWLLGELALPYQRVDIAGAFGGNDQPDYLAKNPNGLVPVLEDGDFILWESNTILRYLADVHGKLLPADRKARAQAEKWMDWQLAVIGPAITPLFWNRVRVAADQRDRKAMDASAAKTTAAVRILDAQLARTDYLGGDAFSIGDIPVAIMAYRYRALVADRPLLANFERWFSALSQRAAFRQHVLDLPLT